MDRIIILFLILTLNSAFGQSGKSVLTQAQKDSIASMIRDSSAYITPETYGAVGDGVTDDTDEINGALDYARSVKKPLVFENKNYYVTDQLDISDVIIYGNGASIIANIPAPTSNKNVLMAEGSLGIFYSLTQMGKKGDQFIFVSDTALLNNLSKGDLVLILSDSLFGDPEEGAYSGEMHEVYSVNSWGVVFNDHLFDNYYTTDNARVAKVNYVTGTVKDLTITSARTDSSELLRGIYFSYAKNPKVENAVIQNTPRSGLSFGVCYAPEASGLYVTNNKKTGLGYGLSIGGATMYGKFSITALGQRHCTQLGGGFGVPWAITIYNSYGTISFDGGGAVFEAHQSVGSVTYINCTAYSGLMWMDYDTPAYNSGSTYNLNDFVYGTDGQIYVSLSSSNIGNDLNNLTYWEPSSGNLNAGFRIGAREHRLINCKSVNMNLGISCTERYDIRLLEITNFQGIDNNNGIIMNTSNIENLVIKDVTIESKYPRDNDAFTMSGSVSNLTFKGYTVKNYNSAISLSDFGDSLTTYVFSDINAELTSTISGSQAIEISLKNTQWNNITVDGYDVPMVFNAGLNTSIDINARNYYNYIAKFNQDFENITFKGTGVKPRSISYTTYLMEDCSFLSVPYFHYDGDQLFYLTRTRASKLFGTLSYGQILLSGSGGYNGDYLAGYTDPSLILLAGSNKEIRDCIVTASPEGSVVAKIGAIARDKTNGKIYFKTSGSGNTGWKEITLTP